MRKRCTFRLDVLVRAAAAGAPAAAPGAPAPGGAAPGAPGAARRPAAPAAAADVVMNGTLASANCGLALRLGAATTHVQAYFAKAVNYTLMVTALSFVQARPPAPGPPLPARARGRRRVARAQARRSAAARGHQNTELPAWMA